MSHPNAGRSSDRPRRGVGRTGPRAAAAALLAAALLTPLFAGAGAAADERAGAAAREEGAKGPDPIDFAVVVDQSKSLSEDDLEREVEAAALISQGEISERSRALVMGFGSAEKEGQSAVDEVCRLTPVDAPGRQELSDCVQELRRPDRKKTGPGTDFPAALSQATDRLTEESDPGTPKVVFLLTDGKLDVYDSANYGKDDDPAARQRSGEKALKSELRKAREREVQVWPLGFGDVDERALGAMAAGGYRGSCAELPDAKPRMRVVDDSTQIEAALQKTFANARCARFEDGTKGKPPTDLTVEIPPIATDGSLTVSKRDPEVRVTYTDPKGREVPTSGRKFGSDFELSGEDGPVEALRVRNPLPGTWRIHLEAPEGHRGREASVSAIWQGRLRSMVSLDPTSPEPGETAGVEAVLQTRDDVVVDDGDTLGGVRATAVLEGEGFEPVKVRLHDDGKGRDRRRGDGYFSGGLEVPAEATGALTVTSEMAAPGVTSDKRPFNSVVSRGAAPVTAHASVNAHSVHPGGRVSGTLNVRNDGDGSRTLRLRVGGRQGDEVRISPREVHVPATGASKAVPYRLSFAAGTPIGEAGGRIQVVDVTGGNRVVDETPLTVSVTPVPTWWDRSWPYVSGGAAVVALLAAALLLRRRAARRNQDVNGLTLELRRNGMSEGTLKTRPGTAFAFRVDTGGPRPRLSADRSGGPNAYELTRDRSGAVLIRPPRDTRHDRRGSALRLDDGLELVLKGGQLGAASGRGPEPGRVTRLFAGFGRLRLRGGDGGDGGESPASGRPVSSGGPRPSGTPEAPRRPRRSGSSGGERPSAGDGRDAGRPRRTDDIHF